MSRSASIGSGSRPTCAGICGRTPRSTATRAEYTGTAKELLIGFLFAIAILVPIYLIYFFISLEAERWQAFASVPLVLFFYLFTQFAIYRARRYRLTRTIWRGVRFWMAGSGWAYAWRAGLWSLLVGLTLGLALPWRRRRSSASRCAHTFYGDLQGRFEGTGGEFFKRGWWLWLLMWPSVLLVIPLPFLYAAFKAIEWRWWVSGIRFGDVQCRLQARDGSALFGLYWKVIGWCVLLLIVRVGLDRAAWCSAGDERIDRNDLARPRDSRPRRSCSIRRSWSRIGRRLSRGGARLRGGHAALPDARRLGSGSPTRRSSTILQRPTMSPRRATSRARLGEGFADSLDVGGF